MPNRTIVYIKMMILSAKKKGKSGDVYTVFLTSCQQEALLLSIKEDIFAVLFCSCYTEPDFRAGIYVYMCLHCTNFLNAPSLRFSPCEQPVGEI